jgi:hypothetical protein
MKSSGGSRLPKLGTSSQFLPGKSRDIRMILKHIMKKVHKWITREAVSFKRVQNSGALSRASMVGKMFGNRVIMVTETRYAFNNLAILNLARTNQ